MSGNNGAAQSELIDIVLEAGPTPARWQEVVAWLAQHWPGTGIMLQGADRGNANCIGLILEGLRHDFVQPYLEYYSTINPHARWWSERPVLQAFNSDDYMPAQSISGTEYYDDFLKPHGDIDSASGIKIFADADRFAWVSVHYGARQAEAYNALVPRLLDKAAPAMRAAIELQRLIHERAEHSPTLDGLLSLLGDAAYLVDERGRVVRSGANCQAPGAGVGRVTAGKLHLRDPRADAALQAALRGGLPQPARIALRDADGAVEGIASVYPLPPSFAHDLHWLFGQGRRALVVIGGMSRPVRDLAQLLADLFALTPSETRVALGLFGGDSPDAISESLGLTKGTVREYLKRIFQKTGTCRQAELVALMARLAANLH